MLLASRAGSKKSAMHRQIDTGQRPGEPGRETELGARAERVGAVERGRECARGMLACRGGRVSAGGLGCVVLYLRVASVGRDGAVVRGKGGGRDESAGRICAETGQRRQSAG